MLADERYQPLTKERNLLMRFGYVSVRFPGNKMTLSHNSVELSEELNRMLRERQKVAEEARGHQYALSIQEDSVDEIFFVAYH
jgi:hypothetical protein